MYQNKNNYHIFVISGFSEWKIFSIIFSFISINKFSKSIIKKEKEPTSSKAQFTLDRKDFRKWGPFFCPSLSPSYKLHASSSRHKKWNFDPINYQYFALSKVTPLRERKNPIYLRVYEWHSVSDVLNLDWRGIDFNLELKMKWHGKYATTLNGARRQQLCVCLCYEFIAIFSSSVNGKRPLS